MSAVSNSAHVYILDACGQHYCEAFMRNSSATIESQKAHCRWFLSRRGTGLVRPAKVVVEFYHDDSSEDVDRRMGR
jgi:hypothetical protein